MHDVTFLAPLRTAAYTSFEIPDRERWVFGGAAIWLEMAAPVYFLSPLIKQTDGDNIDDSIIDPAETTTSLPTAGQNNKNPQGYLNPKGSSHLIQANSAQARRR